MHALAPEIHKRAFISARSMCALASYPCNREAMNEDFTKRWLDGMETIQKTLHEMEDVEIDRVSGCSMAGLLLAFFGGILVLLSTLGLVISGCSGWFQALGFLVPATLYCPVSLLMGASLRNRGELISASLRESCEKLPACLWNDIQAAVARRQIEEPSP